MRVLFLGNNWVGWQVLRWLREQGDEIVGAVVHPTEKAKYRDEIIRDSGLPEDRILDGSRTQTPEYLERIQALRADIGVSVLFDYILKQPFLYLFPSGVINLHPALLPYNRGQYPNVWSIIEGTPAGTTLHYIDAGVDTGDIIAQQEVSVEPVDTGESLYRKLEQASVDLFKTTWPSIREGAAPRLPQSEESGTYHRTRDVQAIDEIDLEATYKARDLINILRARTFPPYRGAYSIHNGKRVYIRVQLEHEAETNP